MRQRSDIVDVTRARIEQKDLMINHTDATWNRAKQHEVSTITYQPMEPLNLLTLSHVLTLSTHQEFTFQIIFRNIYSSQILTT